MTPPATPPPDAERSVTFEYDEHDLAAYYAEAATIDPEQREAWRNARRQYHYTIVFAIALLIGFGVLLWRYLTDRTPSENFPFLLVAMGAGVLGAAWTVFDYRRKLAPLRRFATAATDERTRREARQTGPITVRVTPASFEVRTSDSDVSHRWSGLVDVRESPSGVYFVRRDRQAYYVPRRVFDSGDDVRGFIAFARACLDATGSGDARHIRAFLAEHDAPCPGCRYNLRGVTSRLCPECAREIDVSILRA